MRFKHETEDSKTFPQKDLPIILDWKIVFEFEEELFYLVKESD